MKYYLPCTPCPLKSSSLINQPDHIFHIPSTSYTKKNNMDYRILSSNINYKECRDVIAIDDDGLVISFHRTVRVPETEKMSAALPDLGRFPLYAVDEFKDKLPDHISEKGGLFFPMHGECLDTYQSSIYIYIYTWTWSNLDIRKGSNVDTAHVKAEICY